MLGIEPWLAKYKASTINPEISRTPLFKNLSLASQFLAIFKKPFLKSMNASIVFNKQVPSPLCTSMWNTW